MATCFFSSTRSRDGDRKRRHYTEAPSAADEKPKVEIRVDGEAGDNGNVASAEAVDTDAPMNDVPKEKPIEVKHEVDDQIAKVND